MVSQKTRLYQQMANLTHEFDMAFTPISRFILTRPKLRDHVDPFLETFEGFRQDSLK